VEEEQLEPVQDVADMVVLAIIAKLHVCLVVDYPLNVWSIYGILSPMVKHKHQF
jgi:hypothetical protein